MNHLRPSFFIIGERKCGTSSLYRYLLDHPRVVPCRVKEPQFFSRHPFVIWWRRRQYFRLFPPDPPPPVWSVDWPELDGQGRLYTEKLTFRTVPGVDYITGEASANTFYEGHPAMVRYFLPEVKLILLLRNPVDRTYSHYRMLERFAREGRKGRQLLGFEWDVRQEMEAVSKGKRGQVISPSLYIEQLERWLKVFGRERLLVIRTEDLTDPDTAATVMSDLCGFLGLSGHDFSGVLQQRFNEAPSRELPPDLREELHWFFRPYNLVLEDRLEKRMRWESE